MAAMSHTHTSAKKTAVIGFRYDPAAIRVCSLLSATREIKGTRMKIVKKSHAATVGNDPEVINLSAPSLMIRTD